MAITATHKLLTESWRADVEELEAAVRRFRAAGSRTNDCQVVFFEIAGDAQLHVNVTHRHPTTAVRGWDGPARLPDGFVHNRRFGDLRPRAIVRQVRKMVLAERDV